MKQKKDQPGPGKGIQPPIAAFMYIIPAYLLGWFVPVPFMRSAPALLMNLGLVLSFIGFLLGLGAFVEFRKARTTLDAHGSAKQLVTSGVYRFSRNPIYLGFLLIVIGLPLTSGFYWGIPLAPFFAATISRLVIEREEAALEKQFKAQYAEYRSRVRRWL